MVLVTTQGNRRAVLDLALQGAGQKATQSKKREPNGAQLTVPTPRQLIVPMTFGEAWNEGMEQRMSRQQVFLTPSTAFSLQFVQHKICLVFTQ